jgi:hypothetical protein
VPGACNAGKHASMSIAGRRVRVTTATEAARSQPPRWRGGGIRCAASRWRGDRRRARATDRRRQTGPPSANHAHTPARTKEVTSGRQIGRGRAERREEAAAHTARSASAFMMLKRASAPLRAALMVSCTPICTAEHIERVSEHQPNRTEPAQTARTSSTSDGGPEEAAERGPATGEAVSENGGGSMPLGAAAPPADGGADGVNSDASGAEAGAGVDSG